MGTSNHPVRKILPEVILVKTAYGSVRLKVSSITFISWENHVVVYHMRDRSVIRTLTSRGTFREQVSELLGCGVFVFAFKAQLVNIQNIATIRGCEIIFTNRTSTVCSQTRRRDIIRRFEEYVGKVEKNAGKIVYTKNRADYTKIVPDYTKNAVAEGRTELIK